MSNQSLSCDDSFQVEGKTFHFHSLPKLAKEKKRDLSRLPRSLRILLENVLHQQAADPTLQADVEALLNWNPKDEERPEIQFVPVRVLLQDFTGVPAVADLAAMRAAVLNAGGDPEKVNPVQPVDLIVDHSVQVDAYGNANALKENTRYEFERNGERYVFLKWAQKAFKNFRVVPPATGICHQVNLEYLAQVAFQQAAQDGRLWLRPDTLVGTDSHTPMVNGLGVLGWGVGGIEAEAAMLGQPSSMLIPDVVGFKLFGRLRPGVTATDLVLTITQMLRAHGVVGKFVEFTGPGVAELSIADRATISNMSPEYGATVGYWPIDHKTVEYLKLTGRDTSARLTEEYYKKQELWPQPSDPELEFSDRLELDLSTVEASLAGPSKPHDRVPLANTSKSFHGFLNERLGVPGDSPASPPANDRLRDGSIVIAAITSCTNTSNPALMLGAALLAKKAAERGLKVPSWVKTSFAPGSKAVTEYIREAGLTSSLDALGFNLVGYGCTTCIGNSGPLVPEVAREVDDRDLTVAAVLSGNRNFEARIHPQVRANYLASPPLVIAFALAGRIDIDMLKEPLGKDSDGKDVFLKDIWPSSDEIEPLMRAHVNAEQFSRSYQDVFSGDATWRALSVGDGLSYQWRDDSTYIQKPPFLNQDLVAVSAHRQPIQNAKILALFGDFITTDHISPAGSIGKNSPAGSYLISRGVEPKDFNSYGSRRGNHEIMIRGTFANTRLRNLMVTKEGGYTREFPSGNETTIYEAAMNYQKTKTPLVVIAGREYGSGSSRDWAAKGPRLLGVRAIVAESFERIHRSNLVGMGILPLEFMDGHDIQSLGLKGDETISVKGLDALKPRAVLELVITDATGAEKSVPVLARIDTPNEVRYYDAGGILPYMLVKLS